MNSSVRARNKSINMATIIVIYCLAIIFFFPISPSTAVVNHYGVFSITRLSFFPLSLLVIFFHQKITLSNILFLVIILFKFLFYGGEIAGMAYLFSVFVCLDYVLENRNVLNVELIKKCFSLFSYAFLIQVLVCSIVEGKMSSLVGDKNYLGYFIFFIYVYYVYMKKNIKWVWLILGIMTLSRNFFVSIVLFWIIKLILYRKGNDSISASGLKGFWLFGQLSIIPITLIYCRAFEKSSYSYVYRTGINRIVHFFDESNYLRFKINELAWKTLDITSGLFGFKQGEFAGLTFHPGKHLFPHNTFLVLMVQMGIIVACIYIRKYLSLIKVYSKPIFIPIWFALISYQLFLGPSSFYGIELLIIFSIMLFVDRKEYIHEAG